MNYKELMDKENYSIALKEVKASTGSFSIVLDGSENETNLLIAKDVDVIHLHFPSYATYSVTFEDFTYLDDHEIFEGDAFRIYHNSDLLERLKRKINLDMQLYYRKKNYQHYSLTCFEHQIDVVTFETPLVRFEKAGRYESK